MKRPKEGTFKMQKGRTNQPTSYNRYDTFCIVVMPKVRHPSVGISKGDNRRIKNFCQDTVTWTGFGFLPDF